MRFCLMTIAMVFVCVVSMPAVDKAYAAQKKMSCLTPKSIKLPGAVVGSPVLRSPKNWAFVMNPPAFGNFVEARIVRGSLRCFYKNRSGAAGSLEIKATSGACQPTKGFKSDGRYLVCKSSSPKKCSALCIF